MSTDPNQTPPPPVVPRSTTTPAPEPEVAATPKALEHAQATGVDLTQVEGTGAEGRITKADVEAVAATSESAVPDAALIQRTGDELARPDEPTGFPFFCTDSKHPGPGGPADMFNLESRTFYVDDPENGCPVCPYCNRQTASIPLEDVTQLPPSHRALKERLETAERAR